MMYRPHLICICALLFFSSSTSAKTTNEPVVTTLHQALHHYQEGEFAEAVASIDYARQLIRQKKAEVLMTFLPEALSGWSADEPTYSILSDMLLGGGTSTERHYRLEQKSVIIKIVADSPMIQTVTKMFRGNSLFGDAMGKLIMIDGRRATLKYNEGSGSLTLLGGSRFLITIDGNGVDQDDLLAYCRQLDMAGLEALP